MKRAQIVRTLFFATTVPVLALLYFIFDARHSFFFPACPFYTLTGIFCPGCGSQRAVSALLHGDVIEAMNYNVLLVVTTPLVLYSAGINLSNIFRTRPAGQPIFYSPVFVKLLLATVVLFGVLRNIPVYPFNKLAPWAAVTPIIPHPVRTNTR